MATVRRPLGCYLALLVTLCLTQDSRGFVPNPAYLKSSPSSSVTQRWLSDDNSSSENDADALRRKAQELREQIRSMEEQLGDNRRPSYQPPTAPAAQEEPTGKTLRKKRVLVAGANGRLGSMVCRYLLRNNPETEVVASCHYIGEESPTARGYGRLSYEVGAEDGIGSIGPAWSAENRTATFMYDDATMKDYNLRNLRIVECEYLDPVQCRSVVEGCDAVIWCATDFNGNQPRAVSSLNVAFLFRAVTRPDKGRVDVEGVQNMMGALKNAKQEQKNKTGKDSSPNDPINFVLVSTAPDAFLDFETPFGTFKSIKKLGEDIVNREFPSLTHTILRMSRFDDNFVEEDLDIQMEEAPVNDAENEEKMKRRINRRDAARAAVEALTNEDIVDKTVEVWTATR